MRLLSIVFAVVILFGCTPSTPVEREMSLPTSLGNPHQLLMVADKDFMESSLIDSVDYRIADVFLILPNMENKVDIDAIGSKDFQGYYKHRRNILFVESLDNNTAVARTIKNALGAEKIRRANEDASFRMATEKNRWAKGQQIIYLFAPTKAQLGDVISKYGSRVINKIYEHDLALVEASAFAGGVNDGLKGEIQRKLAFTIDIPQGYQKVSENLIDENTMWIRQETHKVGYNLILHSMPYDENSKLTKENILKIRNQLGKKYISTKISDAYMTTETQNRPYPVFKEITVGNEYGLEARGLYKMVGDYMGGAFISYMVYNPNTKMVAFVDGFLQAPAKELQKEYLLRIEAVMKTLRF